MAWHSVDPHFAMAGFIVGALVGVTGVGGGSYDADSHPIVWRRASYGRWNRPPRRSGHQDRRQSRAWVQQND
jgi:hypothetical protein